MRKSFITSTQHCQRNWDVSKSIPKDHIDIFADAARYCPSKQNYGFYGLKFITDRSIIEQIHDITNPNGNLGFGVPIDPTLPIGLNNMKFYTNPQTLANLLIVYDYRIPYAKQKSVKDQFGHYDYPFQRDGDMAIGISLGYLFYIAKSLGYKTGANACWDGNLLRNILGEGSDYSPAVMLGIGFPNEDRNSREHHTDPTFTFPQKPKEEIGIEFI
jgi:nitroreductase